MHRLHAIRPGYQAYRSSGFCSVPYRILSILYRSLLGDKRLCCVCMTSVVDNVDDWCV